MNTQVTTKVKHLLRNNMFVANTMVQKNWFKILMLFVIAFVVVRKDLNIQLNLVNSPKLEQQHNVMPASLGGFEEPKSEKMSFIETPKEVITTSVLDKVTTNITASKPKPAKVNKPKALPSNLANTFSNIGFVLNEKGHQY